MVEEKEFSLDDFNFDDLAEPADVPEVSEQEVANVGDLSIDDFSFDDFSFPDEADGRKEPFFETTVHEKKQQEEDETGWLAEAEVVRPEEHRLDNIVDQSVDVSSEDHVETFEDFTYEEDVSEQSNNDISETVADEVDVMPDIAVDVVEDEVAVEEGEAPDVSETENFVDETLDSETDDQGSESDILLEINTENDIDEGEHEAFFAGEKPVDVPMDNDEYLSQEEPEERHEEYFASTANEFVEDEQTFANENRGAYVDYQSLSSMPESGEVAYLRWYSAQSDIKMYHIAKGFDSGSFSADEECKTLHINVGYDTYGCEIQLSGGVVMNLRDVREYQLRNGRLPSADGRVVYGNASLLFSGVERIVIYESVKYFSYGA